MAKEIGRGARLGKYIAKSINQFSTPEFQEAVKKPSYKGFNYMFGTKL